MATWSSVHNTTHTAVFTHAICSDNSSKIFWVEDSTHDIYEYDVGTDTQTRLLDVSTLTDFHQVHDMTYFNGELYVAIQFWDGANQWDLEICTIDSETSVSMATSLISTGTETPQGDMRIFNHAEDIQIVAVYLRNHFDSVLTNVVKYSSNGSSWSTGSWDGGYDPREPGLTAYPQSTAMVEQTWHPQGLYVFVCTAGTTSCSNRVLFKWNTSGSFTAVQDPYNNGYFGHGLDVHWTINTPSEWTTDFSNHTDVSNSNEIYVLRQINTPYSFGADNLGGSDGVDLYYFDTDDYVFLENTGSGLEFTDSTAAFIRMDDDEVYLFADMTGTGTYQVLHRSETIAGPATVEFWQGTNNLGASKKADLNIAGVTPANLVVRADASAYVASDSPAAKMVEKLVSADSYATPTDLTDSLSTAEGIQSLDST